MFRSGLKFLEKIWVEILKFNKRHPRIARALKLLIIFSLFLLVCYERLDADFGWHLQAGNYFRRFGIPAHDIFTYTATNFPWIDHEWGNDVIVSYAYQLGGFLLVSILFAALWTAAFFSSARKLPFPLLWLGAIAVLPYTGIRPMVWTVLGLALLIKYSASESKYVRAAIPLGFLLWANLQGGFIIGFAYLGYLSLKERKLSWLFVLLASIAVSFVNPYGPHLYVEIFRTLSDRQLHTQIKEWAYLYIPLTSCVFVLVWITGFWTYSKKRLSRLYSFSLFLFAITLTGSRNLPLFVISSLRDLNDYFLQLKESFPKRLDIVRRSVTIVLVYALVIFCAFISIKTVLQSDNKSNSYPIQAIAYLSQHKCEGNLFNSYNYGGYLIWKLPTQPVYIDGRMASWKNVNGVKYLNIYFSVLSSPSERFEEFNRYNIKCALLTNDGSSKLLINGLETDGWKNVVQANGSILLIASA